MAPQDEPLARFARAFGAVFAGPGGWYLPLPERSEYVDALHRGELVTSADAGRDIWLGCWPAEGPVTRRRSFAWACPGSPVHRAQLAALPAPVMPPRRR